MKKTTLSILFLLVFVLAFLPACQNKSTPAGPPTAATLTLSAKATGSIPNSTIVGGYDVTVFLPAGVTVKSSAPPQTDEGVVTTSGAGVGASVAATYTAATGATPAKVRIVIAKGDGLGDGKIITINTDVASGACPVIADFAAPTFAASGFDTTANSTVNVTNELTFTESIVLNGSCDGTGGGAGGGSASGTASGSATASGTATDSNGSASGTATGTATGSGTVNGNGSSSGSATGTATGTATGGSGSGTATGTATGGSTGGSTAEEPDAGGSAYN